MILSRTFRLKFLCYLFITSIGAMYLGLTTNSRVTAITKDNDKVIHFSVFLIETWLFVRSIIPSFINLSKFHLSCCRLHRIDGNYSLENNKKSHELTIHKYFISFIICTVLAGIGSEFAQEMISGKIRTFDVYDILCNILGSLVGIGTAYLIENWSSPSEIFRI